jgi:Zn-dependent M28 family amino/carboxypeptidase
MATGVDSNGSGVVGVLELARIFSKLYADAKTKGRYNVVFVLTSAGSLNYIGM